ncbi:WD40 repeat-like protein [Paxillus ammoniavirescens]|nr:WD40 repeat-like protein [Paxillus ammoniavirescens]
MSWLYDTARHAYWRVRGLPQTPLVLLGHTNLIRSVAFLPDGKRVISGSNDKTIRAWWIEDGDEVRMAMKKEGLVYTVAASNNGQLTASGSTSTITIWNVTTDEKVVELEGHSDWVRSLAFSPDSTRVASGSYDGTVIVWSTTTGERLAGLKHTHWVRSAQFAPDGDRIASCDRHEVQIWHSHTSKVVIPAIEVDAWSLAWTPNGQQLVTGCDNGCIKFFDASTGLLLAEWNGHTTIAHSIALSGNGKFLASGSFDKTVRLWDTTRRQQIGPSFQHDSYVLSVAISHDGCYLASGGHDRKVRVWSLRGRIPPSLLRKTPMTSNDARTNVHDEAVDVLKPPKDEDVDVDKDKKVVEEDASEGVDDALRRRTSESSSLRKFLDCPAVPPIEGGEDRSHQLYTNFFENDSRDALVPVDEPPKKRFSKFRGRFSWRKRARDAGIHIQPERQQTNAGAEADCLVDVPPSPTIPQQPTAKDKAKQKGFDPDPAPVEDTNHAAMPTPGPKPAASEGHTNRQARNRLSRIRQAIMRREKQEHAYVAELRDRHIFAWETGPLPDEIERGCCFHLASYICYGQRDPNINPDESNARPIAYLGPSDHGLPRTKLRAFGARLDRLLVRLHLRKLPPATAIAVPSPRADHNEALAPTPTPSSNQSPTITITSPVNTTEAPVHRSASPASSRRMPSPPVQALPFSASVDLTIDVNGAPTEMELNPWQHTDTEGVDQASIEGMAQLDLEDPWRNP